MGIAEDIPALIPISIALVVLLLGLSSVLINYSKTVQANDLHRFALGAAEEIAYSHQLVFKESELSDCGWAINSSQYLINMSIRDLERSKEWSCGDEGEYPLVVSVPVIVRGDKDYTSKLFVAVKQ